jgi:hypothetical protein
VHSPIAALLAVFAGAIHRIDDPHASPRESRAVARELLGQHTILGSVLADGVNEKLIRGGVSRLAERLR